MKYAVVTVYDLQAEVYAQPQFAASVNQALRGFKDQVNSEKGGLVHDHPEDFVLYELGTFDDNECEFKCLDRPRQVAVGKDLRVGQA